MYKVLIEKGQVMRNKRYPVSIMLELLASGMSVEEVLADYPGLVVEDIRAYLGYATGPVG